MNGRRAKAIRREARRQGIDPLARTTAYPVLPVRFLDRRGSVLDGTRPAPAINDERRAYRAMKGAARG